MKGRMTFANAFKPLLYLLYISLLDGNDWLAR